MSRHSQTQELQSLVEKTFMWNGRDGKLSHLNEQGDDWVTPKLPFTFLLVEGGCFSITGKEKNGSERRVKSNMGHRDYSSRLTVKWKDTGDVIAEGEWGGIKNKVQQFAQQAKWTAKIYILYKEGAEYKIGQLQLKGRAVSTWMNFRKENLAKITRCAISIMGSTTHAATDSGMESEVPDFKLGKEVTAGADEAAESAYAAVHSFLKEYFEKLGQGEDLEEKDGMDRHMTSGGTEQKAAGAGGDPFDEPLPVTNGTETTDDDGDLPF